jgi:hypothetical protein
LVIGTDRGCARRVFSTTNRTGRGLESSTQRIVICELAVIRFRVRVSGRADILEVPLHQRRFVFRQRRRPGRPPCSSLASAQKEAGDREAEKKKVFPVTHGEKLLTVIHNPLQEYFPAHRRLGTTRCKVGHHLSGV